MPTPPAPLAKISKSPRRNALLAGASALALLGLTFGDAVFVPQPAQAQAQAAPIQVAPTMAPMSFADVVEKVSPAVVSVQVRVDRGERQSSGMLDDDDMPDEFRRFFRRFGEEFGRGDEDGPQRRGGPRFSYGQGSGFIISADGYVVTNNHVIDEGDRVEVTLQNGDEFDAEVVGKDPRTDLAVLKIDGENLPFVEFAGAEARVGDWVVAVGNPFGLGGTVTAGIISARGRDIGSGPYDDYIQIDAPINRGNSGGPAFNLEGQVIGVNTAIFSPSGGNVGIGFAIPAGAATRIVEELRDSGEISRGWIGVSIQSVSDDIAESLGLEEAYGALVNEPQDGSPADDVGIESGDVIVTVDGTRVDDARSLSRLIGGLKPDTKVMLGVLRDGEDLEIALTLGELPAQREMAALAPQDEEPEATNETVVPALGLELTPAGEVEGSGEDGVVITEILDDSNASEKGLRPGDVILEVGGETVATVADVASAVSAAQEGDRSAVLMRVRSGNATRFVAVTLTKSS